MFVSLLLHSSLYQGHNPLLLLYNLYCFPYKCFNAPTFPLGLASLISSTPHQKAILTCRWDKAQAGDGLTCTVCCAVESTGPDQKKKRGRVQVVSHERQWQTWQRQWKEAESCFNWAHGKTASSSSSSSDCGKSSGETKPVPVSNQSWILMFHTKQRHNGRPKYHRPNPFRLSVVLCHLIEKGKRLPSHPAKNIFRPHCVHHSSP